jgi:polysaccharide export outer membrane protein
VELDAAVTEGASANFQIALSQQSRYLYDAIMRPLFLLFGLCALCLVGALPFAASAQDGSVPTSAAASPSGGSTMDASATVVSPQYILHPGDVVQVKVYQEEDLTSVSRVGRDGSISMPLVGAINVGSNSLERAAMIVRDLLAKDYLVNPQVTVSVMEFAKRRFTVLGQVQRPGTYDMPPDAAVSLLQAIATAGGYTRIGNSRKITVQRTVGAENKVFKLDAEAMTKDKNERGFEIVPDDVIVVGEKWI